MLDQILNRHRRPPFVDKGRTVTPRYTVKSRQPISCVAPDIRPDMYNAYLSGTDLTEADLTGAYLGYAKLIKTNLAKAKLGKAYLGWANLGGADLTGAFLME